MQVFYSLTVALAAVTQPIERDTSRSSMCSTSFGRHSIRGCVSMGATRWCALDRSDGHWAMASRFFTRGTLMRFPKRNHISCIEMSTTVRVGRALDHLIGTLATTFVKQAFDRYRRCREPSPMDSGRSWGSCRGDRRIDGCLLPAGITCARHALRSER